MLESRKRASEPRTHKLHLLRHTRAPDLANSMAVTIIRKPKLDVVKGEI